MSLSIGTWLVCGPLSLCSSSAGTCFFGSYLINMLVCPENLQLKHIFVSLIKLQSIFLFNTSGLDFRSLRLPFLTFLWSAGFLWKENSLLIPSWSVSNQPLSPYHISLASYVPTNMYTRGSNLKPATPSWLDQKSAFSCFDPSIILFQQLLELGFVC